MNNLISSLVVRKIQRSDGPVIRELLWRRLWMLLFHRTCKKGYGLRWIVAFSVLAGVWAHSRGAGPAWSLCTAGILTPMLAYLVARFVIVPVYLNMELPDFRYGYFETWDRPAEGKEMWLATHDNKIIATIGISRESGDTVKIQRVVTEKGYTCRGVGRHMMTLMIDRCCSLGYKRVVLETIEDQVEARHLYGSMGFKKGKRTGFLFYMIPSYAHSLTLP